MCRRLLLAGVLGAIIASTSVDLAACGDKFLRPGRSPLIKGYNAVHPSSILLLVPKAAKRSVMDDFAKEAKRAGHRFQAVASMQAVPGALAAGTVDIVIAASDDVGRLETYAQASPSTPSILPMVDRAKGSALASLEQRYGHVLKLPTEYYDALVEIDHVMETRPRPTSKNAFGR